MIRFNLLLLALVIGSALYLVGVQYESRRLYAELDKANSEAHRLQVEKERLEVVKRAQATPARVERIAREKLGMHQTSVGATTYVTYTSAEAVK